MRKMFTLCWALAACAAFAGSAAAQHATVAVPFQTGNNNFYEQIGVNFNFHVGNFNFQQNGFGLAAPQFGGTAQFRRDDRLRTAAARRRGLLQHQCQPRKPVQPGLTDSQRHAFQRRPGRILRHHADSVRDQCGPGWRREPGTAAVAAVTRARHAGPTSLQRWRKCDPWQLGQRQRGRSTTADVCRPAGDRPGQFGWQRRAERRRAAPVAGPANPGGPAGNRA